MTRPGPSARSVGLILPGMRVKDAKRRGIAVVPSRDEIAKMPSSHCVFVHWDDGAEEWVERAQLDYA